MHVAHITSHFASLDYMEVIRVRAIRSIFATRLSHRCNSGARSRDKGAASMAIDAALH
jgi:hypothetical protein